MLFNIVLQTGKLPHSWCISAISKGKGQVNDPGNYRGRTVLSYFGKLFTSVINDRIHSSSFFKPMTFLVLNDQDLGKAIRRWIMFLLYIVSLMYICSGKKRRGYFVRLLT